MKFQFRTIIFLIGCIIRNSKIIEIAELNLEIYLRYFNCLNDILIKNVDSFNCYYSALAIFEIKFLNQRLCLYELLNISYVLHIFSFTMLE